MDIGTKLIIWVFGAITEAVVFGLLIFLVAIFKTSIPLFALNPTILLILGGGCEILTPIIIFFPDIMEAINQINH